MPQRRMELPLWLYCVWCGVRAAAAVTVAASDITDTRASFSNFGRCVDLFAPGVECVPLRCAVLLSACYAVCFATAVAQFQCLGHLSLQLPLFPRHALPTVASPAVRVSSGA